MTSSLLLLVLAGNEYQLVSDASNRSQSFDMFMCVMPLTKTHLADRLYAVASPMGWNTLPSL